MSLSYSSQTATWRSKQPCPEQASKKLEAMRELLDAKGLSGVSMTKRLLGEQLSGMMQVLMDVKKMQDQEGRRVQMLREVITGLLRQKEFIRESEKSTEAEFLDLSQRLKLFCDLEHVARETVRSLERTSGSLRLTVQLAEEIMGLKTI